MQKLPNVASESVGKKLVVPAAAATAAAASATATTALVVRAVLALLVIVFTTSLPWCAPPCCRPGSARFTGKHVDLMQYYMPKNIVKAMSLRNNGLPFGIKLGIENPTFLVDKCLVQVRAGYNQIFPITWYSLIFSKHMILTCLGKSFGTIHIGNLLQLWALPLPAIWCERTP